MKSNENETVVDQIAIPAEGNPAKGLQVSDIDSEATLVSENEENEPLPVQAAPALDVSENPEKITSAPSQAQTVKKVDPPSRPPPEPPRPAEVDRKRQLIEEVELGAQQDVTEVINNVLFQSECAIRPRGIAPDGEQLDQIKE
jgi:ubiquitin carboxyl-terminal hydrolase 25/28